MPEVAAAEVAAIKCPVERVKAINGVVRSRLTLPADLAHLRKLALAECRFVLKMSATEIHKETGTPRCRVFTLTQGMRPDTAPDQRKHPSDGSPDTVSEHNLHRSQMATLNWLWHEEQRGSDRTSRDLADLHKTVSVADNHLEWLAATGYVQLRDASGSPLVALRLRDAKRINLARKGRGWVTGNAVNQVVHDVAGAPRQRVNLRKALGAHTRDAISDAIGAEFVYVATDETGVQVVNVGAAVWNNPRAFSIHATLRGREAVCR